MKLLRTKLRWAFPAAGAMAATFALLSQQAACAIADMVEWVSSDRVGALLVAANALTLVP